MANIASSALNAVACTEGLLSSFGPGGAVMDLLPGGRWWEVGGMEYLGKVITSVSSDSLFICTKHPQPACMPCWCWSIWQDQHHYSTWPVHMHPRCHLILFHGY